MKRFFGFAAVIFSVLLVVLPSTSEALIIDHFNVNQILTLSAPGSISSSVLGGAILGGERDISLNLISGIGGVSIDSNISGLSILDQSGNSTVKAKSTITWDGIDGSSALDPIGLGGADLTESGASSGLGLGVVFDDLPAKLELSVYTNAGNWSKATLNLPGLILSPTNYIISFASFVTQAGTGADFSNVGAVSMLIDATIAPGTDLQIDFLNTVNLVPEPGTMMLIGIGLIGVYGVSRKKKIK